MGENSLDAFTKRMILLPWYKKMLVLRTIEGWTQEEAANKYQCSGRQVWLWNTGKVLPQRNSRKAIAAAHGLELTDIFPAEMLKPGEVEKGA